MFFDVAKVNVKGGDGGDGCMAMRREFRVCQGGPSGKITIFSTNFFIYLLIFLVCTCRR